MQQNNFTNIKILNNYAAKKCIFYKIALLFSNIKLKKWINQFAEMAFSMILVVEKNLFKVIFIYFFILLRPALEKILKRWIYLKYLSSIVLISPETHFYEFTTQSSIWSKVLNYMCIILYITKFVYDSFME